MDQLVLDALNASSTSLTVATTVGGASGTNMNLAKLLAAKKADGHKQRAIRRPLHDHPRQNGLSGMLGETEMTSSDFATVKALVSGEVDTFLGFKFITLGDRDEGGLPLPSTRTCFAFHRDAVGLGIGMNQRSVKSTMFLRRRRFLVSSMFSAGAIAIDDEGIVKI